jgi:hypothetical protein
VNACWVRFIVPPCRRRPRRHRSPLWRVAIQTEPAFDYRSHYAK